MNSQKWYQKNWVIASLLVVFFPLGLILMWKSSNWSRTTKLLITAFFLMFVMYKMGTNLGKENQTSTYTSNTVVDNSKYYFDVPSLVGKDLKGVTQVLGTPQKSDDPTPLQIKMGIKEWEKVFVVDNHELLVTYTISNGKIVDFFIGADDPSGVTDDTTHLLRLANATTEDSRYTVKFVNSINDPSVYTGIKIIPNRK